MPEMMTFLSILAEMVRNVDYSRLEFPELSNLPELPELATNATLLALSGNSGRDCQKRRLQPVRDPGIDRIAGKVDNSANSANSGRNGQKRRLQPVKDSRNLQNLRNVTFRPPGGPG